MSDVQMYNQLLNNKNSIKNVQSSADNNCSHLCCPFAKNRKGLLLCILNLINNKLVIGHLESRLELDLFYKIVLRSCQVTLTLWPSVFPLYTEVFELNFSFSTLKLLNSTYNIFFVCYGFALFSGSKDVSRYFCNFNGYLWSVSLYLF